MAHLRSTIRSCDEPCCFVRESEALYTTYNEVHGYYCKRHAAKALKRRQALEDAMFARERDS